MAGAGILADVDYAGILIACAMLVVLVAIGAFVVMWLRKRIWSPEDPAIMGSGFTLGDLRELHRNGKLSDEEFQKARDKIVASATSPPRKSP